MLLPGGLHEGRAPGLGLVVDVGVFLNEEEDHVLVSLPAGEGKGRVIVAARGDVDLGSRIQQQLCGFIVPLSVCVYVVCVCMMYTLDRAP